MGESVLYLCLWFLESFSFFLFLWLSMPPSKLHYMVHDFLQHVSCVQASGGADSLTKIRINKQKAL